MPNALIPVSAEFQINQFAAGAQDDARIFHIGARDGQAGYFGVLWESQGQTGAGQDVVVRGYSVAGVALGDEISFATETGGDQGDPAVAVLANGTPVVAWDGPGVFRNPSIRAGIAGEDATGANPLGTLREVPLIQDTRLDFADPEIAVLSGGGFALTSDATSIFNPGNPLATIAIFDDAGRSLAPAERISGSQNLSTTSSVVELPGGMMLGLYNTIATRGGVVTDVTLFKRLYDPATGDAQGRSVDLAGADQVGIADLILLNDGRALGVAERLDAGDVRTLIGTTFLDDGVQVADFAPISDRPDRANLQVNLAATPDGGYIAVWSAANPANYADAEIVIRRFDVDLNPVGASEVVNTVTTGQQARPQVEVSPEGEVFVTWTSNDGLGTDAENIAGRTYRLEEIGSPGVTRDGTPGNDRLVGTADNDTLRGSDGADVLDGAGGFDLMQGGRGNDFYVVDSRADVISGEIAFSAGGGIDTVRAFVDYVQPVNIELVRLGNLEDTTNLNATGNGAPGTLVGNAGNNRLSGGYGNDQVNGNDGDDRIEGGNGRDTVVGGAGEDTFVYALFSDSRAGAANRDVVNGFDRGGVQDVIDLSGIDANTATGADDAFSFVGTTRFSGTAGELRTQGLGGANAVIIEGDINGDRVADFQIFVNLTTFMTGTDFVL